MREVGPLFTAELGVDPLRLELFTVPQIVDHLEYMTARRSQGGN